MALLGGGKIGLTLNIWVEYNILGKFFGAKEKKVMNKKKTIKKFGKDE